jgi:hypothetical protein
LYEPSPLDVAGKEARIGYHNLTESTKTVTKQGKLHKLYSRLSRADSLITSNKKGEMAKQGYQTTQVEAQPDWIEARAKTIGYEKHPLEQILLWLDNIMLLLEEIFFKIFQFLQNLWKRR